MDARQELRKFLPSSLGVSDRDLSLILSSLTLRHLAKGDHFVNAGETSPIKGLVTSGCLRVYFTEDVCQRVSTSNTDILVHAIAIGEPHVGVMPDETGQRVANVSRFPGLQQVVDAAPAASPVAARGAEHMVVDHVPPDPAAESHPGRCRLCRGVHDP